MCRGRGVRPGTSYQHLQLQSRGTGTGGASVEEAVDCHHSERGKTGGKGERRRILSAGSKERPSPSHAPMERRARQRKGFSSFEPHAVLFFYYSRHRSDITSSYPRRVPAACPASARHRQSTRRIRGFKMCPPPSLACSLPPLMPHCNRAPTETPSPRGCEASGPCPGFDTVPTARLPTLSCIHHLAPISPLPAHCPCIPLIQLPPAAAPGVTGLAIH